MSRHTDVTDVTIALLVLILIVGGIAFFAGVVVGLQPDLFAGWNLRD